MDSILDNLIDENFINIYHSDLSQMPKSRLKQHYIQKGIKESRILSNLHIQQILRNRYFNLTFYQRHYDDVKNMSPREVINHYIAIGQKEGRIVSIKHASILTNNPEFDIEFYKSHHQDLHNVSLAQLVTHYINNGKQEGRIVSNRTEFNSILESTHTFVNSTLDPVHTVNRFINDNVDSIRDFNNILNNNNNYHNNYISIDKINSFILVIDFPNLGGGTTVFLKTIVEKYKYHQTFVISRPLRDNNKYVELIVNETHTLGVFEVSDVIKFLNINNHKIIKVFVNHIIYNDSTLINFILDLDKEVSLITHDYYILYNKIHVFDEDIINSSFNNQYINKFDKIITQNEGTLTVYSPFLNKKHDNICISELPDYRKSLNKIITNNSKIVIGLFGEIQSIKGLKLLNTIYKFIEMYNLNMKLILFGRCENTKIEQYYYTNIADLNELLIKHAPNVILEPSNYRETYSYTLTLAMLTQLPILSVYKNFNSTIANRLSCYSKCYKFNSIKEFVDLANTFKQDYFYTIDNTIYFNSFWENYFITNKPKILPNNNINFKYNIKPYCIYFPQFHEIEENNFTFYKGYNDIINVIELSKSNHTFANIETPLLSELGIDTLEKYDLTDINIIQKQIDIIANYNIPGFALYYYWFSENTITNKNMVMEKVINNFFREEIDMKGRQVFFIWANESWSKNPAFGVSGSHNIINNYTQDNIIKNVENLIVYFKHNNYLKINNKPVFFIYHTHFMTEPEIDLFFNILNQKCIEHLFSGVHFVVNSMIKTNPNYQNFYLNFNYKNNADAVEFDSTNNCGIINYNKYINSSKHVNANTIQTLVYDFNNTPRLFIPNRLEHSTVCKENTELDKTIFTKKIIETYSNPEKTEIENILLINAWNEWGEKMTFEPSNKYEYYNLNLLYKLLTE